MNWPEDFLDAHERHWEDAELLFGNRRWANADHLYGLAAECGLKALWAFDNRQTAGPSPARPRGSSLGSGGAACPRRKDRPAGHIAQSEPFS